MDSGRRAAGQANIPKCRRRGKTPDQAAVHRLSDLLEQPGWPENGAAFLGHPRSEPSVGRYHRHFPAVAGSHSRQCHDRVVTLAERVSQSYRTVRGGHTLPRGAFENQDNLVER